MKQNGASVDPGLDTSLMMRIIRALLYLSANWPAVAEKRKKGKIKIPAATVTRICGFIPAFSAAT